METAYEEGGDGAESEGFVAAEVGVAEEGSDQGGEVGGAGEDVDERSCGNALHVEDGGEVDLKVRYAADRSQFFEGFVSCN